MHQPWCAPALGASKATPGALGQACSLYIAAWDFTTCVGFCSEAAHAMVNYSHSLSPELIRTETSALQALTFTASFFAQALSLTWQLLKSWKNPTLLQQTISMAVMSLSHVWSTLPMKAAAASAAEAAQGCILFYFFFITGIDLTFQLFRFTHPLVGVFPSL